MKKVSIIYWSCGGNIEFLANVMAESAREEGVEVNLKQVNDATIEDVMEADSVVFGSPAMDSTRIEQEEMQPFLKQLKDLPLDNKKCILFATYGWIENTFMKLWEDEMKSYGFDLVGTLAVKDSPGKDDVECIKNLGKEIIK